MISDQLPHVLRSRWCALGLLTPLLFGVADAKADLVGANVTVAGYCCGAIDPAHLFTNVLTGTVPVDYPEGSLFQTSAFGGLILEPISISVGSDQIVVQWSGRGAFALGSFNGPYFSFSGVSIPSITDVTVDPLSTLHPTSVSFTGNSIALNVAGKVFGPGAEKVILDISAPGQVAGVPEMSTWAMILVGFASLGYASHRRARTQAVA